MEIVENGWLQRRDQAITAYFQKRGKQKKTHPITGEKETVFYSPSIYLAHSQVPYLVWGIQSWI